MTLSNKPINSGCGIQVELYKKHSRVKPTEQVKSRTFCGFFGVSFGFTLLGHAARFFAGGVAVRLQVVYPRHVLINATAPRSLFVSASWQTDRLCNDLYVGQTYFWVMIFHSRNCRILLLCILQTYLLLKCMQL